jgi:hypothetical protein
MFAWGKQPSLNQITPFVRLACSTGSKHKTVIARSDV